VLYNHDAPTTPLPGTLATRGFGGIASLADWHCGARPSQALVPELADRPIVAAAGIARPQRFFSMLRDAGLAIEPLPLPDHHDYTSPPWPRTCTDVVVTEKDAVKIDPERIGATRVWVAGLDFAFAPEFETELAALLGRAP
jgi:tetraacyldisaccharide 4'-kinase